MSVLSVGTSVVLFVLLGIIIYLLVLLIDKLRSEGGRPIRKPRAPQTFVRGIAFSNATNRWQLTCRNELPQSPDYRKGNEQLPPIDPCESETGELAPPLVVREGDVVVYDFSGNTDAEFAWVEFQFPEPDLFVGLSGLPGSFDDFIVRVLPGQVLTLTVRRRTPCGQGEMESRFVYAMHVVLPQNRDATAATGYVQGGSPPEIRFEHA